MDAAQKPTRHAVPCWTWVRGIQQDDITALETPVPDRSLPLLTPIARQQLRHQPARDGPQTQPHHGMTRRHDEVGHPATATSVGQSVWRTWPKASPGPDAVEVPGLIRREIPDRRLDDAADPPLRDVLVQARDLHGSTEAKASPHRRHRHPRLGQDRAQLRELTRPIERQAIPLARLHRDRQSEASAQP